MVVPPVVPQFITSLKDTWEANVAKISKILLVLPFEPVGRVSVDKHTSKL